MLPFQDHPLRYQLANELHARPFPTLQAPASVVYLAFKQPHEAVQRDREQDLAHLRELLDRHGAPHPKPGATHHSARIGRHMLKWEQHTEFVTYTVYSQELSERPFDPVEFNVFPEDWVASAPGQRMTSISMRVCERPDDGDIRSALSAWFVPESLAVASVLDDSAVVAGDFRIDPAGHMRFAIFANRTAGKRRVGRIVQRLCEIETYKTMSMLGFARARSLSPSIGQLDSKLSALMTRMSAEDAAADRTLADLLSVAGELETLAAHSTFRFGATQAYAAIVDERISILRERRFEGRQTFREFMTRRYEPAMRTVKATETRLAHLADRAMRTGELLRTRVDVERSAQNQDLLQSMDRRADLALRLQTTVEGLSVVAISYYAVSLAGYALYPVASSFGISKGTLIAAVTLPVIVLVWYMVRRIRRKFH